MSKCIVTVDLKSEKGKYFVKSVLPVCKHIVIIRQNKILPDGNWVSYSLDIEDYIECKKTIRKIRVLTRALFFSRNLQAVL